MIENFEKLLKKYFCFKQESRVLEASKYSLFLGGKRLRPLILLDVAKSIGEVDSNIERLSCSLEVTHTYSLIHDDLPCMDNDDFRRGKPSCHVQYDYATAVLAGDLLLNSAIEIALQGDITNQNYLRAVSYLFNCSGADGMILGQSLDIFGNKSSKEDIINIAEYKTAKLFSASIMCPVIYFGLASDENSKFIDISRALGVAFQLIDDLLDSEKVEENSILKVCTLVEARKIAIDYLNIAEKALNELPYSLNFLRKALFDLKNKANI
ncbi:MAG: polyprenyl synthetase family protein [Clostridia bacterium]